MNMTSNNKLESSETSGSNAVAGLESHVRNLVLTNASVSGHGSHESELHGLPQQAQPPRFRVTGSYMEQQGQPTPKSGRRRPNQAQRRQMSSQLSIPIDPRPQQPPHHAAPGSGYRGDFSRPPPSRPDKHGFANSIPAATNWAGRANPLYANSSRNLDSSPHPTNMSWNPRFGQYGRQDPPFKFGTSSSRYGPGPSQNPPRPYPRPEDVASQANFLDRLCFQVVSSSEIQVSEIAVKEAFRQRIETICRDVISRYEKQENREFDFHPLSVELKCFGSLSSGFATKSSDLDLGLLSPMSKLQPDAPASPIPRLLERALLDAGLGARLLSRTRVPIIKLCEEPPETLRQALVAERQKWESGIENEARKIADDEQLEQVTKIEDLDLDHTGPATNDVEFSSFSGAETTCDDGGKSRPFQLEQRPSHSLSAYYGLAKRVLRRAGGRDVTASNYREFSTLEWAILNGACHAFVQGLHDSQLRNRVEAFPSLSFQPLYNMPSNRSLLGVFTQVEGERILLMWENWPARETLYDLHPQAERALSAWKEIQRKDDFGVEPILYTRDLQLALDKVKRIPSVQLVLLEQGQHEMPSQYYARAKGILDSLRHGLKELSLAALEELISRYISGIIPHDVRDMVDAFVGQSDSQLDFEAVGQRHKSIHLSREFERALERGMYDAVHASDVARYIGLLRSPLRKIHTGPLDCRFIIPVPPELTDLAIRVRSLQEPRNLAPNLPRDRYRDPLEFPATGVGVQCDINFSAHLALHNTALLRCYSHTDPRVRPMVLFIKHWAQARGINSGYRGTLSSYGYVLMVLHYLVNVAKPFVCPNLQQLAARPPSDLSLLEADSTIRCRGYNVQFWRNESEIVHLAASNQLNHNPDSIGHLLRGFFEYFAQSGVLSGGLGRGFDWGRDVLSLRTQGGLLTKQEKGWTGAKTVFEVQGTGEGSRLPTEQDSGEPPANAAGNGSQPKPAASQSRDSEVKEIRHRYLFAIEDPFEVDHNVARTVTHNGIVSIRDEFRRAWRIIRTAEGANTQENLLQDVKELQEMSSPFLHLLDDIHGPQETWGIAR